MDGVASSSSQQPPQSPSPNATRCPMCRRPQPESPSQQGTAPFVLVPSCGHQPCPECADAIVAFEGISSPHLISSSPPAVPPRVETSACSAPASAASTCLPVGVGFEIWCTVCEGAREAKLEGSAGTPSSPATRMTVWPCLGLDDPVLERWAKRRRLMPRPEEAKLSLPGAVTMCESHQLPLDVFCVTDNCFICARCSFYSSHKGHEAIPLEDISMNNQPSPKVYLGQMSKLEGDLDLLAESIKSESAKLKLAHKQFEEKIHHEFTEMIQMLQRQEECLIKTSAAIASINDDTISKQLQNVSVAREHIGKYKSTAMSNCRDTSTIVDLCDAIPGILQQFGSKNLSPCAREELLQCCTNDIEDFKSKISQLCSISYGPVLECIKEEIKSTPIRTERIVTLCGQWSPSAKDQDIQVRVGESECTNGTIVTPGSVLTFAVPDNTVGCNLPVSLSVFGKPAVRPNDSMLSYEGPAIQQVSNVPQEGGKVTIRGHGFGTSPSSITVLLNGVQCGNIEVTHPHSEITCTVPPPSKYTNQATLTLTVADQQASSTVYYGMWDTASCGKLLFIPTDDPFTVYKPQTSPKQLAQSTVTSTTQLIGGNCVYEWHLSISGLKDYGACKGCYWVAYGLISKPQLDHSNPSPCSSMYGWSTSANQCKLPTGTPSFQATGGIEEVTLRYDSHTLTLTATWALHNNATATVNNVPSGLHPAVTIWGHNRVKLTWLRVSQLPH